MSSGQSDFLVLARWDWVCCDAHRGLHALATSEGNGDETSDHGTTHCGLKGEVYIPGPFTRMGEDRCPVCCQAIGMPEGVGSPKNDEACRPLVEAMLATDAES